MQAAVMPVIAAMHQQGWCGQYATRRGSYLRADCYHQAKYPQHYIRARALDAGHLPATRKVQMPYARKRILLREQAGFLFLNAFAELLITPQRFR